MKQIYRHLTGVALVAMATVIFTTNANAQIPATPPVEAPSPSLVKDGKCYEIRTYYAFPGKLEDLHSRFRNHTLKLFRKHGMEVVGFWGPTDKEKGSENTLVYILAYPSREARERPKRARRTASWSRRSIGPSSARPIMLRSNSRSSDHRNRKAKGSAR
jgi:hypothetical protein